jgi:hypothetical protein
VATIEHEIGGFTARTKWKMKAEGKTPANPPIEVQPFGEDTDGTAHWRIVQQRTGKVLGDGSDKDEVFERARAIAREHKTELFEKRSDGVLMERYSYGNDPAHRPG